MGAQKNSLAVNLTIFRFWRKLFINWRMCIYKCVGYNRNGSIPSRNQNRNFGILIPVGITGTGISRITSGSGQTGTGIFISWSSSGLPVQELDCKFKKIVACCLKNLQILFIFNENKKLWNMKHWILPFIDDGSFFRSVLVTTGIGL